MLSVGVEGLPAGMFGDGRGTSRGIVAGHEPSTWALKYGASRPVQSADRKGSPRSVV